MASSELECEPSLSANRSDTAAPSCDATGQLSLFSMMSEPSPQRLWPTPVSSDATGGPRVPDAKRGPTPGLKFFAADSPASPSPLPVGVKLQATSDGYGQNSRELFAIFVPDMSSLKMFPAFCPQENHDPTWAAYVAGLVDGDGSIWAQKGRTTQLYPAVAIRLGWKGRDILAMLGHRHGGFFGRESRPTNAKHAEIFYWKVQGAAARSVIQMIYPFLRIKRAQAATALHLASIWETGAKDRYSLGRQLQALMWTLNRTGPEFALPAEGNWLYVPNLLEGAQRPKFSTTWPRSGWLSNGIAYQLAPLVPLTDATVFGSLPTPAATPYDTNQGGGMGRIGPVRPSLETMARRGLWPTPMPSDVDGGRTTKGKDRQTETGLRRQVLKMWPTPTARDWRSGSHLKSRDNSPPLTDVVAGTLNPEFVEWMMGFPRGWTEV